MKNNYLLKTMGFLNAVFTKVIVLLLGQEYLGDWGGLRDFWIQVELSGFELIRVGLGGLMCI